MVPIKVSGSLSFDQSLVATIHALRGCWRLRCSQWCLWWPSGTPSSTAAGAMFRYPTPHPPRSVEALPQTALYLQYYRAAIQPHVAMFRAQWVASPVTASSASSFFAGWASQAGFSLMNTVATTSSGGSDINSCNMWIGGRGITSGQPFLYTPGTQPRNLAPRLPSPLPLGAMLHACFASVSEITQISDVYPSMGTYVVSLNCAPTAAA